MSSREITREEAKMLIEKGQIGPFDDFVSRKTGNKFTSILYLKKNQAVGYKFAKSSQYCILSHNNKTKLD